VPTARSSGCRGRCPAAVMTCRPLGCGHPAGPANTGLITRADKGYQGADELVTPYKGKNKANSQKLSMARARRGPAL